MLKILCGFAPKRELLLLFFVFLTLKTSLFAQADYNIFPLGRENYGCVGPAAEPEDLVVKDSDNVPLATLSGGKLTGNYWGGCDGIQSYLRHY